MKKIYYIPLFISIFLLVSCASPDIQLLDESDLYKEPVINEEPGKASDQLVIWTVSDIFQNSLPAFQEKYPDIEIEIEVIDKNRAVSMYLDSLIAEKTPDLFVIPDDQLGAFQGIGGLENLLDEPYFDEDFLSKRPEGLINEYIHEDKMHAVPLLFFPYVTYYRSDILSQHGYPSEPASLSNYMKKPEHWLRMARTLANEGHYIAESDPMLVELALRTSNFVNEEYNYIGEQPPFDDVISAAVSISEENLSPYLNIWDERGKEALRNNELVMIYHASYLSEQLANWVPEQKGKWAVAALPFNLTGIDRKSSMSIAVSSYSTNKEIAWEFAKQVSNDMLGMYQYPLNDPFFANDDLQPVLWNQVEKEIPGKPSMIDQEIRQLWELALKNFQNGEKITDYSVQSVHENVIEQIRQDQKALQNYIADN
ncbi:multiple sugar transport system substrate-binding protein [Gracilibacillus ureilyticus]|uniref:Multiple sugar transport system substrate-binding protein n=1 Tax=Gracilibacillus ureilyticus TaxID=531814 RepID=A0A1H9P399_9BACI|nr:extracellular solute-binding protein [Gracilibacillus ureilyticus]SER42299.1 multiple sugar transport system substrate-binding protein [Gracilibacillus ureilyticus]